MLIRMFLMPGVSMQIPTEEQRGDYTADLDAEYAHRIFAGKSNNVVQVNFEQNVIEKNRRAPMDAQGAVSVLHAGI